MQKIILFLSLFFSSFVFAQQNFEQSVNNWTSQIIKSNEEVFYRSQIVSEGKQSLFAIDVSGEECNSFRFKVFLIKPFSDLLSYETVSFFRFTDHEKKEKSFFMKSNIHGEKESHTAISEHFPSGTHNTPSIFFNLIANYESVNFNFADPDGELYNYNFSLKNAKEIVMKSVKECKNNKEIIGNDE